VKLPKFLNKKWVIALGSLILGVLIILTVRFVSYNPQKVHYHANFEVYINGQKEEFKNPIYYISVAAMCSADAAKTPTDRAHMHSGVNNVVHVEDQAVTWGNFFQNVGWIVDPRLIRTPDSLYLPDDQRKITFILNGQQVDGAMRLVIGDKDKLLVDFGATDTDNINKEYKTVPSTAKKYDEILR
jgi:hypothetical protein